MNSDSDLEALACAGDGQAFGQLIRRWDKDLRSVVWSVLRDRDDSNDVLQTSYEKALRSLPSFRGDSALKTWLHAICYRTALDHVRYEGRRPHDSDAALKLVPDAASTGEAVVHRSELAHALAQLDPESRAFIMMTAGLGYSFDETAKITGVARGTVATKVRRARLALQELRTENDAKDAQ